MKMHVKEKEIVRLLVLKEQEKVKDYKRFYEETKAAAAANGKRIDAMAKAGDGYVRKIATLEKQNGELRGAHNELKKRKPALQNMSEKIQIEQWKTQQRLYEHGEKLNQSKEHNTNRNAVNARQRATDMKTYAPLRS